MKKFIESERGRYVRTQRAAAFSKTFGEYLKDGGCPVGCPESATEESEGFHVTYLFERKPKEEWISFEDFIHEFEAQERMSFGAALLFLKQGLKVAREGWNGKGMWLVLADGTKGETVDMTHGSNYQRAGLESVCIDPHIDMYTAQGTMQPGWLASQADMLAEDWMLVM